MLFQIWDVVISDKTSGLSTPFFKGTPRISGGSFSS